MIGVFPGPEQVFGEDALGDQVVRGEAAGLEQDGGGGGGDVGDGEGIFVVAARRGALGAAPLRAARGW